MSDIRTPSSSSAGTAAPPPVAVTATPPANHNTDRGAPAAGDPAIDSPIDP